MSSHHQHDRMPDEEQWGGLTCVPKKRRAFECDLHFREAWNDLEAVFGGAAFSTTQELALLCFKPDALVGRRIRIALDFLVEAGFDPVAFAPIRLTRHSIREIWRHDWHVYTVDRLAMVTLMHTSAESLFFLLRDRRKLEGIPASVRLRDLRGSGDSGEWKSGELREWLRPPNRVINFVHVADEPADLTREIGIYLDCHDRRALLQSIRDGKAPVRAELDRKIAELEGHHPAHDLDWRLALDRLEVAIGAAHASRLRLAMDRGEWLRWDDLTELVPLTDHRISRWDFICIACRLLPLEREPGVPSFKTPGLQWWLDRTAENSDWEH